MEALAILRDELADEVVFVADAGALDEFDLEPRDIEIAEQEALRREMWLVAHRGVEVAQEKTLRLANVLNRERDVVEAREAIGRRRRMRRVEIRDLPELDERAESRARGNESGRRTIGKSLLVDDADAVALHRVGDRLQMVDFDRQVMHPLAMLVDEFADESSLTRQILDHL